MKPNHYLYETYISFEHYARCHHTCCNGADEP